MLKTTPNFALFDLPAVKIRGRVGEISESIIIKALPTTEPPEYMASTARLMSAVD